MSSYVLDAFRWPLGFLFRGDSQVRTPKEETERAQERAARGDQKWGHSSCLSASLVVEEEDVLTSQENPLKELHLEPPQELSGDPRDKELTPRKLRLILVGKSGSGKSATGNSILGRKVFESKFSSRPVTTTFQRGCREWAGKELEVIDTPDILSPGFQPETTAAEICQASTLSSLGLHAVLLVTQLGRFTAEDQQVVRRLQEVLGVGVLAYTILVFTRKEELAGCSLEEHVRERDNQSLATLDVLCGRRHCGFNNRAQGAEQEAQLRELMEEIEAIQWENEGCCYSDRASQYHQQNSLLRETQGRQATWEQGSGEVFSEGSQLEVLSQIQKALEKTCRCLQGGRAY
ncbi:GTPase IMAP family member 6 [Sciurus carolinensis]|uniref:GTPase IMAP family member 6 n=1 Tax=Sciurus carolinensis TaxID=30640 RepID=UPI001FB4781F|nr:GTPase IMAP family member 6 [Sciurus carolinensis]